MVKGSDVIGLPVVTFDTGERVEKVTDIAFDHGSARVVAFIVDEGGWFRSARVVLFDEVKTIGPDAVIIPGKSSIKEAARIPEVRAILERDNVLRGTRIMTTDGRSLGSLRDLYFDPVSGALEGFEASGGLFADAYEGRSFIPAPQTFSIGEDVAFVPPETAGLMEEQVGGIKGAAQSAGQKIQESVSTAADKLQETAQAAGDKVQQTARTAGDRLQSAGSKLEETAQTAREKLQEGAHAAGDRLQSAGNRLQAAGRDVVAGGTVEEARGRRVRQSVRSASGVTIAAHGQIVDDRVIERARKHGRAEALLHAVGLSSGEAVRGQTSAAVGNAGERLREGTSELRENASNLWEKVKEKVSEAKDKASEAKERTAQQLEERRIKDALGRPVTRVILDKQDRIILNVGELITHAAIERTREEGELDVLLSSVYRGEPDLTPAELRADEAGAESLEQKHQAQIKGGSKRSRAP